MRWRDNRMGCDRMSGVYMRRSCDWVSCNGLSRVCMRRGSHLMSNWMRSYICARTAENRQKRTGCLDMRKSNLLSDGNRLTLCCCVCLRSVSEGCRLWAEGGEDIGRNSSSNF